MSHLIGHIPYPATSHLAVAYSKLYAEAEGTKLAFCLKNDSEKAVNAYRVAVCYRQGEAEQRLTVEEKQLNLTQGATAALHELMLPEGVEEGTLVIEVAIYEDLSHNEAPATFPFATFEVVSRVAESILAGNGARKTAVTANKTPQPAPVGKTPAVPGKAPTPAPAAVAAQETGNPRLPLILSLCALGAVALWAVIMLITSNFTDFAKGEPAFHIPLFLVHPIPGVLALLALYHRKKNEATEKLVSILSVVAVALWLLVEAIFPLLVFDFPVLLVLFPAAVTSLVFTILFAVKRERRLMILSTCILLVALLVSILGFEGCARETGNSEEVVTPEAGLWGFSCNSGADHDYVYFYGDRNTHYGTIHMPNTCPQGHPITALAEDCFEGVSCDDLWLGAHVQIIGKGAFRNATIGNGIYNTANVTTIENHAFENARLDLNNQNGVLQLCSLRTMGSCAFAGSTLYGIDLADSAIETIPTRAFYNCSNLYLLHMSESIKRIDPEAFSGCGGLFEIQWSPALQVIGDRAFENCHSLGSVYFYFTLQRIGDGAFSGCDNLCELRYEGTEAEWQEARENNALQIGLENEILDSCSFHPGFGN